MLLKLQGKLEYSAPPVGVTTFSDSTSKHFLTSPHFCSGLDPGTALPSKISGLLCATPNVMF